MAERKLQNPHADTDDLMDQLTPEGRSLLDLLDNRDPARTPALIARLPASIRAELDALNLSRRDLSRLGARLILLHGTDDAIVPFAMGQEVVRAVPVGQSELFLIDGLAHVNVRPLGLDRRVLWRAIGALLAQRRNPGQGGHRHVCALYAMGWRGGACVAAWWPWLTEVDWRRLACEVITLIAWCC